MSFARTSKRRRAREQERERLVHELDAERVMVTETGMTSFVELFVPWEALGGTDEEGDDLGRDFDRRNALDVRPGT